MFQSTLPHGERLLYLHVPDIVRLVSIHAPTWGATFLGYNGAKGYYVSIHAPTWGATSIMQNYTICKSFQSTLPHGERHSIRSIHTPVSSFNPRSHMGSDLWFVSSLPHPLCFNPRSHMGSDDDAKKIEKLGNVSIHAPTWC